MARTFAPRPAPVRTRPPTATEPDRIPSWREELKRFHKPRNVVMAALLLTYIWRFHDLTPFLSTLRIAAVATVSSWAYLLVKPRTRQLARAVKLPYVWLFLLWSLWMGLMVPTALNPQLAWTSWFDGHFKTVTMVLFTLTCLTSFQMVRFAIAVQVFGGTVLALFYIKAGFPQSFTPVPMYDRNDFSLALNVILPLTLYLAFAAREKWERIVLWGSALAMATSVMMSQSRGGFLALAGIVFFTMVRVRGIKVRYRLLPVILLVGSLPFLPAEIQDRLSTLLNPTEDYNYDHEVGRIAIWKRGLGYLGDFPITGVGIENFPIAEARFSGLERVQGREAGAVTHNSFLQVATETGIPGFLMYMGMILSAVVRLFRIRTRFDRLRRNAQARHFVLVADFTMVSILGFCIGGFFLSLGYTPMLVALIALTAGIEISASDWSRRRRRIRAMAMAQRAGMGVRVSPG